MSQPPAYNRAYSFTNYQSANPTTPLPATQVEIELNNAKATLDAILANLVLIQRDDGALKNASVGRDQLKAEVSVGFNAPSVWVTGTAYTVNTSTVFNGSGFYRCLITHTSGTFATDLAALKWELIVNLAAVPLVTATQIAVTPSGLLTTNAQTSLQALDTGKAATSHTHLSSALTDSTAAGRAMLAAANVAAQQTLLGLGSLAFLSSVPVTTIGANLAFTPSIAGSLLGDTNDWTPTGWATAAVTKISASGALSITGFAATSDGDLKILHNTSAFTVTIPFESASSAAANRVNGPRSLPLSFFLLAGASVVMMYDGTASRWRLLWAPNQAYVPNFLSGLTLSTAGSSATMSIAAGAANDSTNTVLMNLASAISKTTASWAVGTGNGGIDTGAIANSTWYHFYEIERVDTNVVDAIFSLSASAPALPTNYTVYRRIGSGKTNGSAQWTLFTQTHDTFIWDTAITDANSIALNVGSRALRTLTVPTGIAVKALYRAGLNTVTGSVAVALTSPQESDQAPSSVFADLAAPTSGATNGSFQMLTNTSAQIGQRGNATNAVLTISTYGWIDTRGK